jgi:prevent-host-death family protein
MKVRVKISDLKAHLSEYLRRVKSGETIEVLDRETPVANIIPVNTTASGLQYRPAEGRLQDLKLPPPLGIDIDVVALLRQDRDAR